MPDRPARDPASLAAAALERFERPLVDYARRLLGGDLERARDVVQEVFLRLCRQRPDAVDGHLREWLYAVCRNLVADVRRKEGRMIEFSNEHAARHLAGDASAATAMVDARDELDGVLARLAELPPRQREALRLRFQHGLAYREVAGVMGETVGSVSWLIHAGIQGLRGKLAAKGAEL